MIAEQREFMHKPGELIAIGGRVHKLFDVGYGFDPADVACEEYLADCGAESQSRLMPSQRIPGAQFFANLTDAVIKGYMICRECFPRRSDHDS